MKKRSRNLFPMHFIKLYKVLFYKIFKCIVTIIFLNPVNYKKELRNEKRKTSIINYLSDIRLFKDMICLLQCNLVVSRETGTHIEFSF